jgi:FMN phosphatase YigB (HAD superfamily)
MKEIALFDLDGTLVELKISADDFEKRRCAWAAYLSRRGILTELRPLLPELSRVSETQRGGLLKAAVLKSFDELELACDYAWLADLDRVVREFRAAFRRLVLVTHNGSALWERLRQENCWPNMFDLAITRDDMIFFKPDPRSCGCMLQELARLPGGAECWVIGNSSGDRDLGINLRREYSNLVVRTVRIDPTGAVETRYCGQLDLDTRSLDRLPRLMHSVRETGGSAG